MKFLSVIDKRKEELEVRSIHLKKMKKKDDFLHTKGGRLVLAYDDPT